MAGIALELDEKLQKPDPETAASVERLVRDALLLAEKTKIGPSAWPSQFREEVGAKWGIEPFERPAQGIPAPVGIHFSFRTAKLRLTREAAIF
jgi:hypothetical protein